MSALLDECRKLFPSVDADTLKEFVSRHRQEAYQVGWGDGYAEGLGKGLDTRFPDTPGDLRKEQP